MGVDIGKNWFFNSPAVMARVDAARRKALSRGGAFVRTRAKSLIRYRKKPSAAGSPPSAHRADGFTRWRVDRNTGAAVRRPVSPLKELVWFAYDPVRDTVVVGPAVFRAASNRTRPAAGTVPGLVEGGGTAVRRDPPGRRTLVGKFGGTFEVKTRGKVRVLAYKPRPFMGPALSLERAALARLFRNAVGG